jgi:hypothetical protein
MILSLHQQAYDHTLPELENLYRISQRFDLRLRLGLGHGGFYAVLDPTNVRIWIRCTGNR